MPQDHARPSLAGTACILIAAMAFSAKAVIVKLAYAYAVDAATLLALLQFLAAHDLPALALPRQVYWLSLFMAVVSTVIPAWLMSEGIRRTGANHAAMVGSVGPVVTIFLGYQVLHEPVSAIQLFGAALVLAGVTLVSVRRIS